METTDSKTTEKKAKTSSAEKLINAYKDYVLTEGKEPPSIYQFTKSAKVDEADFYKHFNSFEAIEQQVLLSYFKETLETLEADETYIEYSVREKLLAFYYTWIEKLKSNRSFVSYILKGGIEHSYVVLKPFRAEYKEYAKVLVQEGIETEEIANRSMISDKYDELFWLQLMFVLKFWMNDTSKDFENTDAAIEKAVNLSFDLVGKGALESMIDFGKFLFQNR